MRLSSVARRRCTLVTRVVTPLLSLQLDRTVVVRFHESSGARKPTLPASVQEHGTLQNRATHCKNPDERISCRSACRSIGQDYACPKPPSNLADQKASVPVRPVPVFKRAHVVANVLAPAETDASSLQNPRACRRVPRAARINMSAPDTLRGSQ